jgi:PRTRC genetic system protein A
MFKIFINDGTNVPPEDNIYYIIGKEGIFLKKTMNLIDSIIKVDKISILNDVQETAILKVEKIPRVSFSKIVKFYKDIYTKYFAEAVVLLYYNPERKWYKLVIPNQQVSGASANYENLRTIENYQLIGTIHSHGSMSAWHSTTDDRDEKHFDGLHITVGRVDEVHLDISSSIVINGKRFIVNSLNYINGITIVPSPRKEDKNCRYQLDGPLYPYNKKWLRKINKKPLVIQPNQFQFDFSDGITFPSTSDNDSYAQLLRKYYFDEENEEHPCFRCSRFDEAKERFEKDFIKEYDLKEEIEDDSEEELGALNEDFLEKIQHEFDSERIK